MPDDVFGVRQILPTKSGGEEWFITIEPDDDGRIRIQGNGGEINYNENSEYYTMSQNFSV